MIVIIIKYKKNKKIIIMNIDFSKIALLHNDSKESLEIANKLKNIYKFIKPEEASAIIIVGGDGQLLHNIHEYMNLNIAFYGVNAGSVGFLMNNLHDPYKLEEKIALSSCSNIHPLKMKAISNNQEIYEALAINEVAIFRKTIQTAKFSITIDEITRMKEMLADGIMLSTAAGSTAYNLSAGGPILPLISNLLCLTPICPFRPRRWHGALLPLDAKIRLDIIESKKRPVSASADFREFNNISSVLIECERNINIKLLFDHDHNLEDRIIKEQFYS